MSCAIATISFFTVASLVRRTLTPPPRAFPVRKIVGDTRISSLISRFAVYPWFTHRRRNWHPRFWTNAFSQNTNGRIRGCKVRVAPYFSHWPLFSKGKKGIKKGILKDVPYFGVWKKLISMVSPLFYLENSNFQSKVIGKSKNGHFWYVQNWKSQGFMWKTGFFGSVYSIKLSWKCPGQTSESIILWA